MYPIVGSYTNVNKILIDKNTYRENSTRKNYHIKVGDQLLIRDNQENKY